MDSPLDRLVHHGILGDLKVDLEVATLLPGRLRRAWGEGEGGRE